MNRAPKTNIKPKLTGATRLPTIAAANQSLIGTRTRVPVPKRSSHRAGTATGAVAASIPRPTPRAPHVSNARHHHESADDIQLSPIPKKTHRLSQNVMALQSLFAADNDDDVDSNMLLPSDGLKVQTLLGQFTEDLEPIARDYFQRSLKQSEQLGHAVDLEHMIKELEYILTSKIKATQNTIEEYKRQIAWLKANIDFCNKRLGKVILGNIDNRRLPLQAQVDDFTQRLAATEEDVSRHEEERVKLVSKIEQYNKYFDIHTQSTGRNIPLFDPSDYMQRLPTPTLLDCTTSSSMDDSVLDLESVSTAGSYTFGMKDKEYWKIDQKMLKRLQEIFNEYEKEKKSLIQSIKECAHSLRRFHYDLGIDDKRDDKRDGSDNDIDPDSLDNYNKHCKPLQDLNDQLDRGDPNIPKNIRGCVATAIIFYVQKCLLQQANNRVDPSFYNYLETVPIQYFCNELFLNIKLMVESNLRKLNEQIQTQIRPLQKAGVAGAVQAAGGPLRAANSTTSNRLMQQTIGSSRSNVAAKIAGAGAVKPTNKEFLELQTKHQECTKVLAEFTTLETKLISELKNTTNSNSTALNNIISQIALKIFGERPLRRTFQEEFRFMSDELPPEYHDEKKLDELFKNSFDFSKEHFTYDHNNNNDDDDTISISSNYHLADSTLFINGEQPEHVVDRILSNFNISNKEKQYKLSNITSTLISIINVRASTYQLRGLIIAALSYQGNHMIKLLCEYVIHNSKPQVSVTQLEKDELNTRLNNISQELDNANAGAYTDTVITEISFIYYKLTIIFHKYSDIITNLVTADINTKLGLRIGSTDNYKTATLLQYLKSHHKSEMAVLTSTKVAEAANTNANITTAPSSTSNNIVIHDLLKLKDLIDVTYSTYITPLVQCYEFYNSVRDITQVQANTGLNCTLNKTEPTPFNTIEDFRNHLFGTWMVFRHTLFPAIIEKEKNVSKEADNGPRGTGKLSPQLKLQNILIDLEKEFLIEYKNKAKFKEKQIKTIVNKIFGKKDSNLPLPIGVANLLVCIQTLQGKKDHITQILASIPNTNNSNTVHATTPPKAIVRPRKHLNARQSFDLLQHNFNLMPCLPVRKPHCKP